LDPFHHLEFFALKFPFQIAERKKLHRLIYEMHGGSGARRNWQSQKQFQWQLTDEVWHYQNALLALGTIQRAPVQDLGRQLE
jgi:hypothetical protein